MMEDEAALQEKRAELKRVINEGMEKTFPAYFFNAVGRGLRKVFRLKKQPHWSVSAFVLGVLMYLPGIMVAVATREIFQWKEVRVLYVALIALAYLAPIVSHINVVYNVLPGIRDELVDSIQSIEDLDKLQSWMNAFWSLRKWLAFVVWCGLLYGIVSTIGFSLSLGSFLGFGLTTLTFSVGPFFVIPLLVIFYMLTLPSQLADYHLNLYESDPANSEIILRLNNTLNVYLYILAGYVAISTALISLNPATTWFVFVIILIGWIPTILQFLINQYAMRKIIITAKWGILNRLQAQIKEVQKNKLIDVADTTLALLNQLMDLHDRISAKPNSILTWGTGLSFLNQLMLPLLGLLLGNLDKLLKLLARTP